MEKGTYPGKRGRIPMNEDRSCGGGGRLWGGRFAASQARYIP